MARRWGNGDSAITSAAELVAAVEGAITAGQLTPGERMEPVRALAAELGLAPNTVAAAYRTLGERGLLLGEGRRGTFVATRPALTTPPRHSTAEGLTDLASGNPDPAFLPDLGPALAAAAAGPPALYGSPGVDAALAELLRADLAADGVRADDLAVVGGALDGIERVLDAHLRPGDRVAVEDPGYGPVLELVSAMRLRTVPMALDQRGVTPEALAAALASGVVAVVVTPRAQNPTGAAFDGERAAELAAVLRGSPQALVVEDDHANRVAGAPYHPIVPTAAERWATVRSVAKSLGPDLRLAALVGDPVTVSRVAGRQALGTGWVSHLLQRAVAQLLADPAQPARLAEAARAYGERRAVVVDRLVQAGLVAQGRSGMNAWVPVDDEAQVVAAMQYRGYALRPGARYRSASPPGVRVSTAGHSVEVLAAAAEALVEVLAARERGRRWD